MRLREIAQLIPGEYRREILELNMIDNAVAIANNPDMNYLGVIWKNYVDSGFTGDCNLCYGELLKNLKALKGTLIELENESKMLNAL